MNLDKIWNGSLSAILSAVLICLKLLFLRLVDLITTFLFRLNIKEVGKNIKVLHGLEYRYPKVISLGDNVIIGANTRLLSEVEEKHFLEIASNVSIGERCHIDFSGGIKVEEWAHIAHDVLVLTHDHGYNYLSRPQGKSLHIMQNAFIGDRAIIMHGCNYIGKNSIIGTGAIVTKDVPDNAIVAGVPAKIIKYIN